MSYIDELEAKLQAARIRVKQARQIKALKESAPELFEIIDTEISLEINKGYGDKPLTYEQYLESHGAVRGIKRIRNIMDAREAEEVAASEQVKTITENVKILKDEQKRQ